MREQLTFYEGSLESLNWFYLSRGNCPEIFKKYKPSTLEESERAFKKLIAPHIIRVLKSSKRKNQQLSLF